MELQNDFCMVQITIDSTYTVQSRDNRKYDLVLNPENYSNMDCYSTFHIHVDLFNERLDIALIGNYYSYDYDCAILDEKILTIMQNNIIMKINVENGKLIFYKKIECFGCNFALYRVKDGYIIYGEIEIIMLDTNFEKKWKFCGRDIFVSASREKIFELCENHIKLYDWDDNYYEIDYDGKLILNN